MLGDLVQFICQLILHPLFYPVMVYLCSKLSEQLRWVHRQSELAITALETKDYRPRGGHGG